MTNRRRAKQHSISNIPKSTAKQTPSKGSNQRPPSQAATPPVASTNTIINTTPVSPNHTEKIKSLEARVANLEGLISQLEGQVAITLAIKTFSDF